MKELGARKVSIIGVFVFLVREYGEGKLGYPAKGMDMCGNPRGDRTTSL